VFLGVFTMHGFYARSASRPEKVSLDLKQIFQVKNVKFGESRKGMTGLVYELKSAIEPMPIDQVKIWYDPNNFKIARREYRVKHKGKEETLIEDYLDVQLGAEKAAVATPKEPPAPVSDAEMDNLFFKAKMTVAESHFKAGKKAQAVEILEEIIKAYPKHSAIPDARRLLAEARIPVFRTPDPAVEMFGHLSSFYRNQRALLQTPGPLAAQGAPDLESARLIVDAALAERRSVLSEMESKALLAAFRIPIARTVVARSAHEAMLIAGELGMPVAMKIDSPDITHKSDVNGVRLNVAGAQAVQDAWQQIVDEVKRRRPEARVNGITVEPMVRRANGRELMVGMIRDPVFGPAIVFGTGGTAVEVHRDRAVALPPLNQFLVADMIRGTRVAQLLGEFRRMPPVDMRALEEVLLRVSELVCELPALQELDINPLIADESGAVAVDARVVLRPAQPQRDRYAHMAIHPYPAHLVSTWLPAGGPQVTVRPIRPEDAELEQEFIRKLSPESRYFRFMDTLRELTPAMLVRFTQIDYDREMAFVATLPAGALEAEIGVCRYITNPDGESCEFAIVIADDWHRKGLGRRLMGQLIDVARARGLRSMIGHVLSENRGMLQLCQSLGFSIGDSTEGPMIRRATLALT